MKRCLLIFSLLLAVVMTAFSESTEKLNYVVTYKWGLIQKDAGDVEITKKPKGDGYELKLIAKTRPWADRVYKVRDTLTSVTGKNHYQPDSYTYIAHEKNKYRRDNIKFTHSPNGVKGFSEKYREKKNGDIYQSSQTLEGDSPVYDMLSVYFFIRDINYHTLKAGDKINATIFSGDKVEQLTVRCEGKEMIKLRDKTEREAWHILFNFTMKGGKKSSDDINCWVSTDEAHIPLLIVGNLPIGQVRVHYVKD